MAEALIRGGIYGVILSLPLYLVRFQAGWLSFNFSETIIYLVFIGWLFSKRKSSFDFRVGLKYFYPACLIFMGVTFSTLFSSNPIVSAGIWQGWLLAPLLLAVVALDVIKNNCQLRNVVWASWFSGLAVALIAMVYWLNGQLTYDGRLAAFYGSANYLAMFLSPILILSFYLWSSVKKKNLQIILLASQIIFLGIIYLTYSFGAWLGLLVALLFILFSRFQKKGLILYLIISIILLLFFGLLYQAPSQKFQNLLDFSYPAWQSRLIIWQSAWSIIKDAPHNFFWGIGPGMFQDYYLAFQPRFAPYLEWAVPQPHNLFLAFWLQAGLLGLIGFIWLLIVFFKNALSVILMAAMLYLLVHGLVDTTYWKNDLSVIFWLLIVLSCKASRLPD